MALGTWQTGGQRSKKLDWGIGCGLLVADSPSAYDCKQCIATGKQNRARGRDCLLERDYSKSPLPYSFKVRNERPVSGTVRSEEDLYTAIQKALDAYKTEDIKIALKKIGKLGVCPKSFPITAQTAHFIEIHSRTHAGDYGTELRFLPLPGSLYEQPNLFFVVCDIINRVRSRMFREKLANQDNLYRSTDTQVGDPGQKEPKIGRV